MIKWEPELPNPSSTNWREAYGAKLNESDKTYTQSDNPSKSSYQAPGGSPVYFIYESMKLSSGYSVDTAEYPFFGLWSSTSLNEKPHGLTVSGCFRGDEFIKDRNNMINALRVSASDDEPGFLSLPLWGRFPVIVTEWSIDESAKEGGQSKINISFTRAGCPLPDRNELKISLRKSIPEAAEKLKNGAIKAYVKNMADSLDETTFITSFNLMKKKLIETVGRIQGAQKKLNEITNAVSGISNLLAQGIRAPKDLALSLFGSAAKIVSGVFEIRNAIEENIAFFRIKHNEKNTLFCFLSEHKYASQIDAVTIKQAATKKEAENLYRTSALYAAALLIPGINSITYEKASNIFSLYDRLEKSIDLNDPDVYFAVSELRSAVSQSLIEQNLTEELSINVSGMPLLALAHYLGVQENILRELNRIEDSFIVRGKINYV